MIPFSANRAMDGKNYAPPGREENRERHDPDSHFRRSVRLCREIRRSVERIFHVSEERSVPLPKPDQQGRDVSTCPGTFRTDPPHDFPKKTRRRSGMVRRLPIPGHAERNPRESPAEKDREKNGDHKFPGGPDG